MSWMTWCRVGFAFSVALAVPNICQAGELVLTNTSTKPLTCHIDGFSSPIVVPASVTIRRMPNLALAKPVITSVECGGLLVGPLKITPTSPDGILVFNGRQNRALSALLYPFIPTLPQAGFTALVNYIVNTYQAQNPAVLLFAAMDPGINTYDFDSLAVFAGPNGFDVLEVDMSFLGFLVTNGLINPVVIKGDQPWPIGLQNATWNGTLYGIPSWLCTDFYFYFALSASERRTRQTAAAAASGPVRALVADFDGSWELPALYLNAYAETYGASSLPNAFTTPIDTSVIQSLAPTIRACNGPDGNPCIDGRFHQAADGTVEKVFATGNAWISIGFSERSFFSSYYQTVPGFLGAFPASWVNPYGTLLLVYTDAFVTNRALCSSATCQGDSQAFTTLMTSAAMKSYIAFSQDLPPGTPPRHLLVATMPFWNQSQVQSDSLYQQFGVIFNPVYTLQPFPNWFTAAQKKVMSGGACTVLKTGFPNYSC